jgi:F-type H+-transporting ATPase subunit b
MEIVQTTALITINETLGVQILLFLVFLLVINRLMFRPIRQTLKAREDHCTTLAREVADLQAELKRLTAGAEEEEGRIRAQAHGEREALRAEGHEAAAAMAAAAVADIERRRAEGEARIAAGLDAARRGLETDIREVTEALMAKILERGDRR